MQTIYNIVNWFAKAILNDRLEAYLGDPLSDFSIGFSLWTGVLSLSTRSISLHIDHRHKVTLNDVEFRVSCYRLATESIDVFASRVNFHRDFWSARESAERKMRLLQKECTVARIESTLDLPTLAEQEEDEREEEEKNRENSKTNLVATRQRDTDNRKRTQDALREFCRHIMEKFQVNVRVLTIRYDEGRTLALHNIKRIVATEKENNTSALSVSDVALILYDKDAIVEQQTVIAEPGIELRLDTVQKKVAIDVVGQVQIAIRESTIVHLFPPSSLHLEEEEEQEKEEEEEKEKKEGKNSWLCVKLREKAHILLSETNESEFRPTCTVVEIADASYNGKFVASQLLMRYGDVKIRLNKLRGTRVSRLSLLMAEKRVAFINNLSASISGGGGHVVVNANRETLNAKTTAAQLSTLVVTLQSLGVHLAAFFPYSVPGLEEARSKRMEEEDGEEEEEESSSKESDGSKEKEEDLFAKNVLKERKEHVPRVPMPSRESCPLYVQICDVGVAWTLANGDADKANSVQLCALIPSVSYRQCAFPTTQAAFETLTAQCGFSCAIKEWQIRDNVSHSHWRLLIYCNSNVGKENEVGGQSLASVFRVVQKTCFLPRIRHAFQIRAQTCPLTVCLHQATLHFLQNYLFMASNSSSSLAINDPLPAEKKQETQIQVKTEIERLEIDEVQAIVDYKPSTDRETLQRLFTSADFVYLLQRVPVEKATLSLNAVRLFNVKPESLADALMAHYAPDWKQLATAYVSGIQPVHIVLKLGTSVFDLVRVPIAEYRKGNDAWKAMQDGARTVTVEALQLSTRASTLTNKLLRKTDRLLQSRREREREREKKEKERHRKSVYSSQPDSITQGIEESARHIGRGVVRGVKAVTREPLRAYRRGGAKSLLLATARGIPRALILQPAIGVTDALARLSQSATNTIDPLQKREADVKYKK